MHTVPLHPPYTQTAALPIEDVPTTPGAVNELLTHRIAHPITERLRRSGYEVPNPDLVLTGSQLTVDTMADPGYVVFTAVFPHPTGEKPHEMHPLRDLTIELVGGLRDGYRPPKPTVRERIQYPDGPDNDVTYDRAGYNLTDGSWAFQLVPQNDRTGGTNVP